MAAVGTVEAEEAGGEVAAAKKVADGGEDVGAERAEGRAVFFLVRGEEGVPGGSEDLTTSMPNGFAQGRAAIAAGHCQSGEARGRRGW